MTKVTLICLGLLVLAAYIPVQVDCQNTTTSNSTMSTPTSANTVSTASTTNSTMSNTTLVSASSNSTSLNSTISSTTTKGAGTCLKSQASLLLVPFLLCATILLHHGC